jgi:hypothetical protein
LHFHHAFALWWAVKDERREIVKTMLDKLFAAIERDYVSLIARKQKPAMSGFEGGNVILDEAAQPHHVNSVSTENVLLMITDGDVEKYAGQKDDDENAGGSAREELEVKMLLAEKPREASPEKGKARAFWLRLTQRFLGLAHYNF